MSAAAPILPATPISAFCKVPNSYFGQLIDLCNFTQIKVWGLILDLTVGWGETWSEVSDEQFRKTTNVTDEHWRESISDLQKYGLIRVRKSIRGRDEYAVSEKISPEIKAARVQGKCGKCHMIGDFETGFVPVPHPFLRHLPACLDHSSFVCLAVIIRYSLHTNRDLGVWSDFQELDKNDFERLTGLDPKSISNALALLCDPDGWNLVERQERKGKAALYRAIPENFGKIGRRDARVVVMPTRSEKQANTTRKVLPEKPAKTEDTQEIESTVQVYGFCRSCGHYGAVEEVSEQEFAEANPKQPARAAPERQNPLKKPPGASPAAQRRQESRNLVANLTQVFIDAAKKIG